MNNFESLLKEKEMYAIESKPIAKVSTMNTNEKSIRQKSDKGASLYDFITMVSKLVELVMPNVEFIPDEGRVIELDAMKSFDKPVITYNIISRKTKTEIKPRVRELVTELDVEDGTERIGEIWGQKFKCLIQFNIYASVYKDAEQVMEMFEETMIKYAGFLKKNGVAEIFFDEHLTDEHFDTMRETLSIRNLRYYVEIEKLTVIFKEKIQEIESLLQKK